MDYLNLIAIISVIIALGSVIFTSFTWRVAKATLIHNILLNVQKDYRSSQMLFALETLYAFFREHGQENFVEKYEEIREKERERISGLEKQKRIEAIQTTLHHQRRLISHFYRHLAELYVNRILPKEIVYRNWSESDLRIIPNIIVPIENKLREVLHTPPKGPLKENHSLLVLYGDSKDFDEE